MFLKENLKETCSLQTFHNMNMAAGLFGTIIWNTIYQYYIRMYGRASHISEHAHVLLSFSFKYVLQNIKNLHCDNGNVYNMSITTYIAYD